MPEKIQPHNSITNALSSEDASATPFSHIPAFLKRVALQLENGEKITNILQIVWEKELDHLNKKVENIWAERMNAALYNRIKTLEWAVDEKGRPHSQKLIWLAKEIIAGEFGGSAYEILNKVKPQLGTGVLDPSEFINPHTDIRGELPEADKNLVQQEQQVRVIMNALIMWAWHRIFDHIDVKKSNNPEEESKYEKAINKIDPALYKDYYDMVYSNLKYMRESNPSEKSDAHINTGLMKLIVEDKETKIEVKADIFPVLLHEMAKGVMEYIAYTRYNNLDENIVQSILSVDSRQSEHWMMLIGPQIYKQLFFLIKEALAQYAENHHLVGGKKESDYIIPVTYKILQLPAEEFLSFIENILNPEAQWEKSLTFISNVVENIHTQYEQYLQNKLTTTPKVALTIEQIIAQLTSELGLDSPVKSFVNESLDYIEDMIEKHGYAIDKKQLWRKLVKYFPEYIATYGTLGLPEISQTRFTLMSDIIYKRWSARREIAAFAKLRESQKKVSFKTKDSETKETKYIQPRFTLRELEEAKNSIDPKVLTDIDNQIKECIRKKDISEWIKTHNDMSTQKAQLTEQLLTLDEKAPECIADFGDNWGLYELRSPEQLKRESGMMGGHCVDDYDDDVAAWSIKIFSLRHGTQSHWTIWYQLQGKKIHQVKGYTNKVKNSILSRDEADFPRVIQCLQFLCSFCEVHQIWDIQDFIPKNFMKLADGRLYSPELFKKNDQIKEQYFIATISLEQKQWKTEETVVRDSENMAYRVITHKTVSLKDNFAIKLYKGSEIEIYYPKRVIVQFELQYRIFTKDEQTGNYNQSLALETLAAPEFGVGWLEANEALIQKNKKYGILRRVEGEKYETVVDCNYDSRITFWNDLRRPHQDLPNEALVRKGGKYGVLKRNGDNTFGEIVPCVYDNEIETTRSSNVAKVMRDGKRWLLTRSEDGTWEEILECVYDDLKVKKPSGLYTDTRRNIEVGAVKNGKHGLLVDRGSMGPRNYEIGIEFLYKSAIVFWESEQLGSNEAWISTEKGTWILRRNADNSFEEVLPCKYESVERFGTNGLLPCEMWVKSGEKYGIVRKESDGTYQEIVACICSDQFIFDDNGIAIIRDEEQNISTIVIRKWGQSETKQEVIAISDIGEYYLDDTFIQKWAAGDSIWRKDESGEYVKLPAIPLGVSKVTGKGKLWLADNEYRIEYEEAPGIMREIDGKFVIVLASDYSHIGAFGDKGLFPNCARITKWWNKHGILWRKKDGTYQELIVPIYDKPCEVISNDQQDWLHRDESLIVTPIFNGETQSLEEIEERNDETEYDGVYGILRYYEEEDVFKEVLPFKYHMRWYEEKDNAMALLPTLERMVCNKDMQYLIIRRSQLHIWEEVYSQPFEDAYTARSRQKHLDADLREDEVFIMFDDQQGNIIVPDENNHYKPMFPHNIAFNLTKAFYEYGPEEKPSLVKLFNEPISGKRMAFTTDMSSSESLVASADLNEFIYNVSLRCEDPDKKNFYNIADPKEVALLMLKSLEFRKAYFAIQNRVDKKRDTLPVFCETHDGRELRINGTSNWQNDIKAIYEFEYSESNPYNLRVYSDKEKNELCSKYSKELEECMPNDDLPF